MTDKIILNITHSDDYTDYLFLTAGLTNRRIIPLLNPSAADVKRQADINTKVFRCYGIRSASGPGNHIVQADPSAGSIRLFTRNYLQDDGTILPGQADMARHAVQELLNEILFSNQNLREAFWHYFPLLWSRRQKIYANPSLFFAYSGRNEFFISKYQDVPIGTVLKALEEDPGNFRLRLGGGCNCSEKPILVDYDLACGEYWTIYTWCPVCGAKRVIRAGHFHRSWNCENSLEETHRRYDKGQGLSSLSLFDVIDELS